MLKVIVEKVKVSSYDTDCDHNDILLENDDDNVAYGPTLKLLNYKDM